jgi:ferrous iron transport protein B
VFLKQAGTVILLISVVLWAAKTYPKLPDAALPQVLAPADAAQVAQLDLQLAAPGLDDAQTAELDGRRQAIIGPYLASHTVLGRVGHFVQPIFAPLGFDEKISVAVLASFAAREVAVSTLAIVTGVGEDAAESDDKQAFLDTLSNEKRADGTPLFTTATCLSLLVFFVLAMQCLPTQAITRRETGSWKWAAFQLAYMTLIAWSSAFVVYHIALWLGGGA